jgi:hypothetical protein
MKPIILQWDEGGPGWPGQVTEMISRLKWHGYFQVGTSEPRRFWSGSWNVPGTHNNAIELVDVALDTSETFNGTVVKRRMTWHSRILLCGASLFLREFDGQSEKKQ